MTGVVFTPWSKIRRTSSHAYFVQSYIAFIKSDYPLVKQDSEVEAIKWFTKDELFKLLDEKPEMFLFSTRERATDFFNYANQS